MPDATINRTAGNTPYLDPDNYVSIWPAYSLELANRIDAVAAAGTATLGTSNLNDITTAGTYTQTADANATLANNYPVASSAGILEVDSVRTGAVVQRYTPQAGAGGNVSSFYIRRLNGGAWSAWYQYTATRWNTAAGRAIHTASATGSEQLIYGDTGWRNVSSLLTNGWTGSLYLRRFGHRVSALAEALNPNGKTSDTALLLPAGFQAGTLGGRSVFHNLVVPASVYRVAAAGTSLNVVATTTAGALYGACDWYTEAAWPTTLPGTAVGTIPTL